jgi:CRP-like cAMP-binding protein
MRSEWLKSESKKSFTPAYSVQSAFNFPAQRSSAPRPFLPRSFDTIYAYCIHLLAANIYTTQHTMFEVFENHISTQGQFTPQDLQLMRSLSTVKTLRRKEFLLQEGDVCRYKIFVTAGLLKSYCLTPGGTEHIMRFSPENHWITDHDSFKKNVPSKLNIEALEPTQAVVFTRENLYVLTASIPAFKTYFESFIEKTLRAVHERVLMNLSATSEEKYEDFIASFPDVFRRVPLHMVASYLGVSRETLSRIRHARMKL